MSDEVAPAPGLVISIRVRRDLVVVDPDRFSAAARAAYRELNPDAGDAAAAKTVADVTDTVHTLLERALADIDSPLTRLLGRASSAPEVGRGAPAPGVRGTGGPDGLCPAGWLGEVVLGEPRPLQDYGCFLPSDPFALPGDGSTGQG